MTNYFTFRIKWMPILLFLLLSFTSRAQNFSVSSLQGENLDNPTSLQFGPDGRLYVAQQDGLIYAYTIQRNTSVNYQITASETINNIKQIQNHDDDGTVSFQQDRQVTGILVTGTANNVVIYVGSSDSRIGGGGGASDLNLDTNSGIISRLTKSGNSWQRVDLVRGLPRSEENHANNGMQLIGNTLYVAQGGNTNAGAPSNNFAFATEYALSGAILTVDLAAIDAMSTKTWTDGSQYKYDLPTLDDPTRSNQNGQDIGDPFGGNDGLNQAKLVPGGPVQIYVPGFRNIYDLVWTQDNKLYTWDNGPNGGWGGHPANEGVGTATNNWISGEPGSSTPGPNDGPVNNKDGLHYINSNNYYGGHPNPVRSNPNGAGLFTHDSNLGSGGNVGVWRTSTSGANPLPVDWPPVPANLANPIEGDYQNPGVDDPSIYTITNSTNGIVEYTASNFNNAMKGDLLAVAFNGPLYRVQRNASGVIDNDGSVTTLANNFGSLPLDITAQGDNDPFPGTIWVANLGGDNVSVFEPQDFGGCGGGNNADDEDGDQYTNNDELSNGTDPCNAASMPADFDKTLINGFLVSNLNDPDDDDDGILDTTDPFVWDAQNGTSTSIPIDYPLLNANPGFGFFGLGFTGLMSNGATNYLDLIQDENNSETEIIAGGAVGLLTFNDVPKGDPYTNNNTQQNGFQFGLYVNQNTAPFVYETKLLGPIFISTPQQYQSAGIFIGTGDQSNYLKAVINGNGSTTGVQILYEESDGVAGNQQLNINNIGFESEISLFMQITPSSGQVQVQYAIGIGNPINLGQPVQLQGNVLNALQSNQGLAMGIITTSISSTSTFNATYDYIKVNFIGNPPPPPPPPPGNMGNWVTIDNGTSCNNFGQSGSCAQGRHEAAYVQVGNKFYLLGGRENSSNVNIYDPATDTWTIGANAPYPVHHVQALAYDGLIYLIGSFIDNNFPNENPNPNIVIYDPLANQWLEGPAIPSNRLRGSSGAVIYQDKIYIVNGLTNGHASGWVNWFDVFDPKTNQWSTLPNSPRARDHFHAAISGNKLYVAGGRRSGQQTTFTPTIGEVDVFNFQSNSWSTLSNNIPTQRAAASAAILGNELIIMGGERDGGIAFDETEALNLSTNNWRSLDNMIEGRHGTQAIVNNNGIYVASGSPLQGGGQTRSQEAFFFGNQTTPTGNAISASTLSTSANTLNFSTNNSTQNLTLSNSNGTQAILIQELSTNNDAFTANISTGLPLHLPPGGSVSIAVNFSSGNNATGQLTIQHTGNNAPSTSVNLTTSSNPPPPADGVYINVGGPTVSTGGITWGADQYFSGGNPYSFGAPIGGTTNDVIYQTNRWLPGNLQYNIPVANGNYEVELHFAEIYFISGLGGAGAGKRVFDISLEGQQVVNDYDVNAVTGSSSPFANVQTFTVAVNDGTLNLLLQKQIENPMISAIAVTPSGNPPPPPPPGGDDIFINVGGPTVSTGGITWGADQYFSGGNPYSVNTPIANTSDDIIYQTNRWLNGNLNYNIPVNNGTYQVDLHFAELVFVGGIGGAGKRVYDVNIEGQQVINDYDVNAITGANSPTANVQTFTVSVADGTLNISLQKQIENPQISAIAVRGGSNPLPPPPPPPPPPGGNTVYINAGGPAVSIDGINWGADQYFNGGNTYSTGASIANTTSEVLYQTERWLNGDLIYNMPVANGSYEVQLHFAEIAFSSSGNRVFDISLEGQQVLNNYDIVATTGSSSPSANIQTFTTSVGDGTLNIVLSKQVENPKISAIAILPASSNRSINSQLEAFATIGRKVRLNWGYTQINQPLHYELEYARGTASFQQIAIISAEESTDFEAYGTTHELPAVGANHYQVKVVFPGGAYSYIKPQTVDFEGLEELLTVFPNPTKGQLFLDLSKYSGKELAVSLLNINGVEVLQRRFGIDHAPIVELDVSSFENGFYLLQAKVERNRLQSQKVMIMRRY